MQEPQLSDTKKRSDFSSQATFLTVVAAAVVATAATGIALGSMLLAVGGPVAVIGLLLLAFRLGAGAARRRMAEELVESESRFRLMADHAPVLIWVADTDGLCTYFNRGWLEFTGRTLEQELGDGWVAGVHPEDRRHCLDVYHSALEARRPFRIEYRLRHHDGTYRWVLDEGVPRLADDGRFLGFVGSATDVDELREAESERRQLERKVRETQRLESMGALAGGIAHDFNNLLAVILSNAEMMEVEFAPGSPARESVEQIEEATLRAAELCRQMLSYAGQGSLEIEGLDLGDLIADTSHLLEASAPEAAVLDLRFADEPLPVSGDPAQLRQVVMNLVLNSADAVGERRGRITVATGVVDVGRQELARFRFGDHLSPGSYAFLRVEDTGTGMDEETLERLFDPFYTTKSTGRGLGLAAVLGIVRAHGGAIEVVSEPKMGTGVTVLLPLTHRAAAEVGRPGARAVGGRLSGTALLIDDERSVLLATEKVLRGLGLEVIAAEDGDRGLEAFRRHRGRIRVAILDLKMPGLAGGATLRELHRLRPGLPVVLISGRSREELEERFGDLEGVRFLTKPYRTSQLAQLLGELLEAGGDGEEGAPG